MASSSCILILIHTQPPLTTDLHPLIRLRAPRPHEHAAAPLAFTLIQSTEATLPPALLPSATMFHSPSTSPASVPSVARSQSTSPNQRPRRPTNFQDILVFDPADARLVLRRIFVERSAGDAGIQLSHSIPIVGGTSISLPGMSTLNRLGTSPGSQSNHSPGKTSALTQMIEKSAELVAREMQVGAWQLGRGRDWPEVRSILQQSPCTASTGQPFRTKE